MQNPFNHENYPSNELKRNTFPCSYQFNTTMKYGYIYPAGIWRTIPGSTYKIKPTLGLNFMPTVFPVQTRQKVFVHYFYGRDRNFWKDYKDFVNGQRPDLVKPYIDEGVTKARTGSLLDYLGVPTTIVGAYGSTFETEPTNVDVTGYDALEMDIDYTVSGSANTVASIQSLITETINSSNSSDLGRSTIGTARNKIFFYPVNLVDNTLSLEVSYNFKVGVARNNADLLTVPNGSSVRPTPNDENYAGNYIYLVGVTSSGVMTVLNKATVLSTTSISVDVPSSKYDSYFIAQLNTIGIYSESDTQFIPWYAEPQSYSYKCVYGVIDVRDIDSSNSPYWRSDDSRGKETIKLNAYLPRFYETVYNLYYRNPQNNPYILDGRPEYNKFIPSKDGGIDSNLYELRRRNWEDDFLTTAVQSPQQGIAPLVGLTDRGATLTLTNEDGTVTRYNVTTTENGSITGIEANDTSAEPILTKALIDAVSYGISIEDIRNVNAMQKWLELNLRKGYQYKDIIQARWGISISYNELDLPEFIGGFTQDVQLQAVTQTANVNDDVTGQLGWQAGRLYASGDGREITHYCDEEGFIMCLITVVPVPNYSQLLPKHWFERDLLDSYQPEFNHIGFQPITYKEVCPVQAFQESTENVNVLEQTFGYQRPWYQYFNYTDEVHGQFRTTFKDFLINRVFDVKPELSESFLLVDPEQVNDVFNVPDADDDKIIGAIYHNCVAKLPISLYAQARLE